MLVQNLNNSGVEIWGGIECTINRIGNEYLDQLEYAKHYKRENDINLIAELGIKTLRFPILWERHQPEQTIDIEWDWTEKQLSKLTKFGITPIAGLLHHGSGPAFTDLLDEDFASKFANYAKQVALKFPWIEYYTPINEPLTTARFSGLYGFWYPHKKNDISFARMFLNQMKGTVLAMHEIRKINPKAKLVQTEDLAKTFSTPYLNFQANFENERRWLTLDLLCGNVKPGHSMWEYFIRLGILETTLNFFVENPCPPNIAGFNFYVTSERFLDENIEKYPLYTHGGNELQVYADVEATRVRHNNSFGLSILLKEAWNRFGIPMAITEAHMNCSREEQLRWFKEIWDVCTQLNNEGINIRGVTAWSLFGAFGWTKLLTSKKMEYETGVFDVSSEKPRKTALAILIKELTEKNSYSHPLVQQKGWWHRDIRFAKNIFAFPAEAYCDNSISPILIVGKRGTLGKAYAKICEIRGINYRLTAREDLDITDKLQIESYLQKYKPWAVINAAGFVKVDEAETETEKCFSENKKGSCFLAEACEKNGIKFMTFSSDLVFDGNKTQPYMESDKTNPINIYGISKAESEVEVLLKNPNSLVIRTSSFFGPWDEYNFVTQAYNVLSQNKVFSAANDIHVSPTYVPDLVSVSMDLLIDDESGIWHLTNKGETTWAELALNVCERAGLNADLVNAVPVDSLILKARRPKYSVLKTEKGVLLPSLENALNRYFKDKLASVEKSETIIL